MDTQTDRAEFIGPSSKVGSPKSLQNMLFNSAKAWDNHKFLAKFIGTLESCCCAVMYENSFCHVFLRKKNSSKRKWRKLRGNSRLLTANLIEEGDIDLQLGISIPIFERMRN